MGFQEFLDTLDKQKASTSEVELLKALWYLKMDNWDKSHDIVSNCQGKAAAWIHGLLHKIEGDLWNANYWYRQAGVENPTIDREAEIDMIIEII